MEELRNSCGQQELIPLPFPTRADPWSSQAFTDLTPREIISQAIKSQPLLEITDSKFLNHTGIRPEKYTEGTFQSLEEMDLKG